MRKGSKSMRMHKSSGIHVCHVIVKVFQLLERRCPAVQIQGVAGGGIHPPKISTRPPNKYMLPSPQ